MSGIARRLAALERAPAARGVDLRVFGTDADAEPSRPGMEVLRIITGVPRPWTRREGYGRAGAE